MRLCSAAIVANESDIIEAFARHTLSFVDHLHILFHNSYDTSQLIVQRLVEEGLSITTEASADPAFRRELLGCELIRTAAGIDRFDYILPLDADELIVADSRLALEAELAAAPVDGALSVAWLSYVPTCDDNLADPNPLTRIRMRSPAPHPTIRKVFFRADIIESFDDVILADGNHQLLSTKGRVLPERRSDEIRLAHYPVRSPDQLASKAVLGAVARQISPDFKDQSRHWRSLVGDTDIVEHRSWERVSQVARSYLGEAAASPLISAPLVTPAHKLRYADLITIDPFARLARCIAAVAATGALRPIDAIPQLAGLTGAVPRNDYKELSAELDVARRMIQHLHGEIAVRDAVIARRHAPAQKPPRPATAPATIPPRSSTRVAASERADGERSAIQVDFEAPVTLHADLIIAARITGVGQQSRQLWYRIPAERAPDELTIAHAFTISLINIAMAIGSELRIDGPLSRGLLQNLEEYQAAWSRWMPDRFHPVRVRPREIVPDEPYRPELGFVVPFSGGLDSLHSAWKLKRQGQLGALTSIHGLDIPLAETGMWSHTLERLRRCAQSIDVPLYPIATNWETLARDLPGYLGFFLPVIAAGVLTGRGYGAIISSSAYPYDHLVLPQETNPLTDPLLGRPSLPVLHWGASAHRIDKVAAIADWPEALESLRPCDSCLSDGRACGRCRKCIQTAVAFLGLGLPVPAALGSHPPTIADIEAFEMTPYARLGLQDAVESARRLGIEGEWVDAVERRCAEPARTTNPDIVDAAAVADLMSVAGEMRRRLDFVLGGMHRPAPMRRLRQTLRALRGMTGPRDLLPLAAELPPLPEVPIAPAPGARVVQAENGRLIYVDPTDMRGAALVKARGNLKPVAMTMWRQLVAERRWTHILDVGANYGEMLVGIDIPDGARLIAVEPNPHVGWHLERTLQGAGLRVEVVRKAISDGARTVDMTVNRTWSGMTAISVDRTNTIGHRTEPIRVDAITLADLLESESDRTAMAVLVKIDVEGHEVNALKGLAGIERDFGTFAALVEITQLTAEDLAWLWEHYTIDLLEAASGHLKRAPIGSASELSQFLARGDHHVNDVVLRLK